MALLVCSAASVLASVRGFPIRWMHAFFPFTVNSCLWQRYFAFCVFVYTYTRRFSSPQTKRSITTDDDILDRMVGRLLGRLMGRLAGKRGAEQGTHCKKKGRRNHGAQKGGEGKGKKEKGR